jgi:hypothetical protein
MTTQPNNNSTRYYYWLFVYKPAYPTMGQDDGEKYLHNKSSKLICKTETSYLTKNDILSLNNDNLIDIIKLGKMTEEEFSNSKSITRVIKL